ncbi:type II toxin-antitoxin system RelE/ParE family toxin [Dolichospermum planctonicum UHCC 0167]|jgi:mRNA interferase RelE/StbE|uniref:type II toxin-antitoxin system RelE family toxin n=1 Tax=Dolichospermum planctonicum TaxID=136072 RepID=UPI001C2B9A0A|nr:type II toxin-antitoxin system RelE/ParE family toxin [Dolichospermum planctonicum]MCW9680881.1 type II toxin-antitoxin system RelE/ParE family toxin [Dolichospermum planctonicum UHCC 0167]
MELNFSKNALKFLKKLSDKDTEKVRNKILQLLNSVEESGLVPSGELDIKTLEGE